MLAALGFALHDWPPVSDGAVYAYGAQALVHGQRMYVDFWDNKPPGIFLVNSVWLVLFGHTYALWTLGAIVVGGLTAALNALLVHKVAGRGAPVAALLTFVFLSVTTQSVNAVEHYAAPFIVASALFAVSGRTVAAGLAIGAATLIWLPAASMLVPLRLLLGRRIWPAACAAAAVIGMGALAVIAIAGFPAVRMLVLSWTSYVAAGGQSHLLGKFVHGAVNSGALPLLLLLAAVAGRPVTAAQRFGLAWTVTTFAATACAGSRFYEHYFKPADVALAFTVAVYLPGTFPARWRVVPMLAAIAVFAGMERAALNAGHVYRMEARDVEEAGTRIVQVAGPRRSVALLGVYDPEFFIDGVGRPANPYQLVAQPNTRFLRRMHVDLTAQADVVVEDASRPIALPQYRTALNGTRFLILLRTAPRRNSSAIGPGAAGFADQRSDAISER